MMRSELSPAPAPAVLPGPARLAPARRAGDAVAVAVLLALPVIVFGIPALLGHAVLPGDDLTQNFPLRVLAGREIRSGQLPLYNPYIWGGAPLLAGWNAGAAYPLTFLFAVLPPTAAWTLNMIATWAVAGLGMFFFLRALRLGSLPGFLGALSFAFAGAMSAQVAHFGLIAGMSWVPVQLLGVLRLTQTRSTASRLRWIAVLAAAMGLTILAGEPRAIADAAVIVIIYAAWRVARLGRRCGRAVAGVAAGLVLGLCLGAVQWMPGLAVIGTSQRGASSVALFNSGSLPHRWLLLLLVPDLLGGSGSLGQPGFFAHYNLAEVTGYLGIFPLVAAAALLGRFRLRPRPPEWIVWHFMALAGVVLALGGNTPLGGLLAQLPLFGGQRLQSRNILVADLALAVLLAYWADHPFSERSQPLSRAAGKRRIDLEMVLGAAPPLAVVAVVVLGLAWGAGLLHWLRVGPGAAGVAGSLKPWLVPYALIGAGAIAFVIFGRHLRPRLRSRWLGSLVVIDLVVFTLLAVVAVLPGLGRGAPAAAGRGAAAAARPVAALGYPGRFAIYDPGQVDAHELPLLGSPDLNAIGGPPSVQGYSSIVGGFYASATGAHRAMGDGQDVLDPRTAGDGTLDQLGTSVLLTVPAYLVTATGRPGPDPGPPGTGQRDIAADQHATWYFATPLAVSRLAVPDADARQDAAAGTQIGLMTSNGSTHWFRASAPDPSQLAISLPHPEVGIAVVAQADGKPRRLGPLSVLASDGSVFVANGQLQDALVPPRWGYAGHDGSFAVFVDHFAQRPLSLEALPGRSTSGASVRRVAGSAAEPAAAAVSSPRGVRVVRSVAAIPGWSATWRPQPGRAVTLAVRRAGVVQAVDVPPGKGVVTWSYVPPWFTAGFALSLGAAALILLLVAGQLLMTGRRARRSRWVQPMMYPVRLTHPARAALLAQEQDGPAAGAGSPRS
jgi:type IV secretory pathway VirB2 component (pilin)